LATSPTLRPYLTIAGPLSGSSLPIEADSKRLIAPLRSVASEVAP